MLRYSVKRLLQSCITLLLVVSILFLMLRLMPIHGYFPDGAWDKMSWDAKLNVLVKLGLYGTDGNPINPFIQLFTYFKNIVTTFSLGETTQIYPGTQVTDLIAQRIPVSMSISSVAFVFSLSLGCILGVLMARYKESIIDGLGMVYIVLANSIPALVYYFIVQLNVTRWIGASMIYRSGQLITFVTPVICLIIGPLASNALWIRRYMVDEFNRDYVKLAYAKGLPSRDVMFGHVLRNAFVPMAYSVPQTIVFTLSGSLLVERLFSIPGMGRLLVDSADKRDNNLVQALVFIYAAMGIIGVFLGDVLAVIVDPRISFTRKGGLR